MLFSIEELAHMHANYLQTQAQQQQPRPKTKAEKCESDRRVLLEVATEDPTLTVAELAEAAERSPSWVRRHLKQAGITLVKPVRRKKAEVQP